MDLVQTAINAGVIAVVGTLLAAFVGSRTRDLKDDLKADIGEIKQDVRDLRLEMNDRFRAQSADIKDLRSEMNERFREHAREIASLRSDVTQVALALGSRPQPQAG